MIFTDDDLKRLKEMFGTCEKPTDEEIKALLARLEAAEKVCALMGMEHLTNDYRCEEARQPLNAWRKACGK